ncbi:hypothetical protein ACET3Z_017348 [Daucus carota]
MSNQSIVLEGIDDVDDFISENEEEENNNSISHTHLHQLVNKANKAFRQNRFEEAINCYSGAINIKPHHPVILGNRCAAYLRICLFLVHRPPSDSEYRPLSGLDPTVHAGLALKDADKMMNLQSDSVKAHILKADALILLQRFELAHDIVLSGLQIDPSSVHLRNLVRMTCTTMGRNNHEITLRTDDFDCTVCLKLIYEPITTPCGHSFCRSCLFQAMDRCNRCPLCRTILFISPRTCSISVTLNNIIQKNFPEEYAERKLEHENLTIMGADLLPLFVMDVVLPCQKLQLNIFEPRYRLMVRRIMEGNRRMGMVTIDSTSGSVADHACEVEITDCEALPDGRFFLEVEGRRRCHIIDHWDQDGYRVAEIEWIQDICPAEGTEERLDLEDTVQKAEAFAKSWMRTAQEAAQGDQVRLAQLLKAEELMPTTNDPEHFSFWLATLTNRRPSQRLDLLRMRDTNERVKRGLIYLKAAEQFCTTQ